jgi:hypothetical protein
MSSAYAAGHTTAWLMERVSRGSRCGLTASGEDAGRSTSVHGVGVAAAMRLSSASEKGSSTAGA